MLKYALLLKFLVVSLQLDQVLLIYSEKTSNSLLEEFKYFKSSMSILDLAKSSNDPDQLSANLILDLSCDVLSFPILDEICESLGIFYLTLTTEQSSSYSKARFNLKRNLNQKAEAVIKLLKELKWNSLTIGSSDSLSAETLSMLIAKESKNQLESSFTYSKTFNFSEGLGFVLRVIKVNNVRYLILIDEGESLQTFQSLLTFAGAAKYGFYLLVVSNSVSLIDLEGSLLISEKYSLESRSPENQIFRVVQNFLENLQSASLKSLESICPSHECGKDFEIINIQEGLPVKVGTVKESVEITGKITFPGNNKFYSLNETFETIQLSRFNGSSMQEMKYYFHLEETWYRGADFAVERFNEESKEFQLKINPFYCDQNVSDWLQQCFRNHEKFIGIAYLSQFNVLSAYESLKAFRNLSINVPQISPMAESTQVKFDDFLEFIRMGFKLRDYYYNMLILLYNFKWKDFIVFTTDDPADKSIYSEYMKIVRDMKLSIKNPEDLRIFPANYSRDNFKDYKLYFEYAKESRCRIFHILSWRNGNILEGLYDIGLRRGDVIVMGNWQLYYLLSEDIEEQFLKKRREMMESALLYTVAEYIGDYGKEIKKELTKRYKDTRFMCLTHDMIAVILNTISYMNILGQDYEDSILFLVNLVRRRTIGCTGDILFAGTENYRLSSSTGLSQVLNDKTTETYSLVDVARLSTSDFIAIRLEQSLTWVDSNEVPSNYIKLGICGINEKDLIQSRSGRINLLLASLFTFLISIVSSILSSKFYKYSVTPTEEQVVASYQDMIFLFYFPCQLFQFLCLEPKGGFFSETFSKFQFLAGLSLFEFFELENDLFWKMFYLLIAFTSILTVLFIFCAFIYKYLDEDYVFQRKLIAYAEDILPGLNNLLIFPIISMLLEIFDCNYSTGHNVKDSFLERDCRENCYTGKHLIYSVIGTAVIAVYCSTACYLRIFWDLIQKSTIFGTNSEYLSILSTFQVLLIVIHKNLSIYDQGITGFVISGLLFLFSVFSFKMQPYNYKRINFIQVSVFAEAGIIILLSSFYVRYGKEFYLYVISLVICFISVVCSYKAIDKTPIFFIQEPDDVIPTLIKFEFSYFFKIIKS